MKTCEISSFLRIFFVISFLIISPLASAETNWQSVARLMDEQKFNAASDQVDTLLKKFKAAKNNNHWRQALVLGTTLKLKTDPIEETAKYLTNQQWPNDKDSKLLLNLYLAKVLTQYVKQNHWEIHNRETIKSKKKIGIEKKTIEQINADINLTFKAAYQLAQSRPNDALGSLSLEGLKAKNLYFINSDYPLNVRGGIKDTIAYLWVEHLLDSSMWSIAEQGQKAKLALNELLSPVLFINPADTTKHPLLRAVSLLNQLEQQEL
ncbi:hypothetical protein [uncultured Cocleimonas sp.]|uniref:hypothetical protein n=1 Tax=uncultured Cocleimonas sp. TaxID=1051587 RepID=UPI00260F00C6|nr:hypothetical protein [uncultured Cocleimonas sp.]